MAIELYTQKLTGGGAAAAKTLYTEEIPREGATAEKLAKLPAVFKENGTVTAGNSCALCDAAASVVIMKFADLPDILMLSVRWHTA